MCHRCKHCKKKLPETKERDRETFGGHGRPRNYCNNACRQKAKRKRATHKSTQ